MPTSSGTSEGVVKHEYQYSNSCTVMVYREHDNPPGYVADPNKYAVTTRVYQKMLASCKGTSLIGGAWALCEPGHCHRLVGKLVSGTPWEGEKMAIEVVSMSWASQKKGPSSREVEE